MLFFVSILKLALLKTWVTFWTAFLDATKNAYASFDIRVIQEQSLWGLLVSHLAYRVSSEL